MKSVIICGGGYSVRNGIDNHNLWHRIQGKEIWSLNSCFKAMPYLPSKQLFIDRDFWRHDADDMEKLYKQGIPIITRELGTLLANRPEIIKYSTTRVRSEFNGREGIQKNCIFSGNMGLVGIFALHLAYCQYDTIYLLGYDFGSNHVDNKKTHWYQDQMLQLNIQSYGACRPEVYLHKDSGHVNQVREDIKDFSVFNSPEVKIWNISENSHINYFEKINYETFFKLLGV